MAKFQKVNLPKTLTRDFWSFYVPVTGNTRRNGQPPKSQLAKKSTCQKVNLPKSQLAKKVNSLKTPTIAFLVILCSG
jgi:hypothetical protein